MMTLPTDDLDGQRGAGSAALVLVDIQREFVHPEGRFSTSGHSGISDDAAYRAFLGRVNAFAVAFRARGPVFHVVTEVRSDYVDSGLAPMWAPLGFSAAGGLITPGSWGTALPDELEVGEDDVVVVKKGHSAFRGTTLDRTLRTLGVQHVLLGGGAIGGCLADSSFDGSTLGYRMTAVSDLCFPLQRVDSFHPDITLEVSDSDTVLTALGNATEAADQLAVVVLDWDERITRTDGLAVRLGASRAHLDAVSEQIGRLRAAAADALVPVISVSTAIADRTQALFPRTAAGEADLAAFIDAGPLDAVTGPAGTIVKSGLSGFSGTPLDRTLRNLGVRRVLIVGGDTRTDRSVVATVREGAALGYEMLVATEVGYPLPVTSLGDADRRCTLLTLDAALALLQAAGHPVALMSRTDPV